MDIGCREPAAKRRMNDDECTGPLSSRFLNVLDAGDLPQGRERMMMNVFSPYH